MSDYQRFTDTTAIYRQSIRGLLGPIEEVLFLSQESGNDVSDAANALIEVASLLESAYVILGLIGEAGEIANKFKKVIRDGKGDSGEIVKELGDVQWYAHQLATLYGVEMEDVLADNQAKLSGRMQRNAISGNGDNR